MRERKRERERERDVFLNIIALHCTKSIKILLIVCTIACYCTHAWDLYIAVSILDIIIL